jgi:hypothetical protein
MTEIENAIQIAAVEVVGNEVRITIVTADPEQAEAIARTVRSRPPVVPEMPETPAEK